MGWRELGGEEGRVRGQEGPPCEAPQRAGQAAVRAAPFLRMQPPRGSALSALTENTPLTEGDPRTRPPALNQQS